MRRVAVVLCSVVLSATAAFAQGRELSAFNWLAGKWASIDGPRSVEEQWTAPTANMMVGMSRTVRDGRTTAFEFLRIEKRGADVFYVPQPGGKPPVAFKLVSDADGRFVFENLTGEDRVSRIEYRRDGEDALYARIEGAENQKPFAFEYRYRRTR
jgi:hypothetical protein